VCARAQKVLGKTRHSLDRNGSDSVRADHGPHRTIDVGAVEVARPVDPNARVGHGDDPDPNGELEIAFVLPTRDDLYLGRVISDWGQIGTPSPESHALVSPLPGPGWILCRKRRPPPRMSLGR